MSDVKRPPIVTSTYRYKRPPRKKQPVSLPGPAVVTRRARPGTGTPKTGPTAVTAPPPANDDRKPAHAAASGEKPAVVTARKPSKLRSEPVSVSASPAPDDRSAAAPSAIVAAKHRNGPTLPMELPLSRKPIERDGGDYKQAGTNELASWYA